MFGPIYLLSTAVVLDISGLGSNLASPAAWPHQCFSCPVLVSLVVARLSYMLHKAAMTMSTAHLAFLALHVTSAHVHESCFSFSLLPTPTCVCFPVCCCNNTTSLHAAFRHLWQVAFVACRSPSPSPPSQQQREQHAHRGIKEQASQSGFSAQTHTADAPGMLSPEASSLAR